MIDPIKPRHDGEPWIIGDTAHDTLSDLVTETNVYATEAMEVSDWTVETLSEHLFGLFADDQIRSEAELRLIRSVVTLVADLELDPQHKLHPTLITE